MRHEQTDAFSQDNVKDNGVSDTKIPTRSLCLSSVLVVFLQPGCQTVDPEEEEGKRLEQVTYGTHECRHNKCRWFYTWVQGLWKWYEPYDIVTAAEELQFQLKREDNQKWSIKFSCDSDSIRWLAHLADTSLLLLWTSDCTCCISRSWGGSAYLLPGKHSAQNRADITGKLRSMKPAVKRVKRSCDFQKRNRVLYLLSATFLSCNTQTL